MGNNMGIGVISCSGPIEDTVRLKEMLQREKVDMKQILNIVMGGGRSIVWRITCRNSLEERIASIVAAVMNSSDVGTGCTIQTGVYGFFPEHLYTETFLFEKKDGDLKIDSFVTDVQSMEWTDSDEIREDEEDGLHYPEQEPAEAFFRVSDADDENVKDRNVLYALDDFEYGKLRAGNWSVVHTFGGYVVVTDGQGVLYRLRKDNDSDCLEYLAFMTSRELKDAVTKGYSMVLGSGICRQELQLRNRLKQKMLEDPACPLKAKEMDGYLNSLSDEEYHKKLKQMMK